MKTTREPGDPILIVSDSGLFFDVFALTLIPSNQTVRRKVWDFKTQQWGDWFVCDASTANPGDLVSWDTSNGARQSGEVQ